MWWPIIVHTLYALGVAEGGHGMACLYTARQARLVQSVGLVVSWFLLMHIGRGSAAEPPNEILIGATLPLSGRFTPMAGTFDRLCQSWAKLVNASGGIAVKAYGKKL